MRFPDVCHGIDVAEDLQGLLEGGEVVVSSYLPVVSHLSR